MNVNKEQLISIIRQEIDAVLTDLGLILPLPLEAEPEVIQEDKSRASKIIDILNKLETSERERIFRAFRRYSYAHFLEQIRNYELAKKP